MGPGHVHSPVHTITCLDIYLQEKAPANAAMNLTGNHHPAAAVSGKAASFELPVHVITNYPTILEGLTGAGFHPIAIPLQPGIGPIHKLTEVLLQTFIEP